MTPAPGEDAHEREPVSPLDDFAREDDRWLESLRRAEEARPGGILGSFEILEELGHGGQGSVFRARQRHMDSMAELPPVVNRLQRGEAAIPTVYEEN